MKLLRSRGTGGRSDVSKVQRECGLAVFGDHEPITEMVVDVLTSEGVERQLTVGSGHDFGLRQRRKHQAVGNCTDDSWCSVGIRDGRSQERVCDDSSMTDSNPACLAGDVNRFLDDPGAELVREYFDPTFRFSGAAFGEFAGGGDAIGHRCIFTAEDLVAVTLLDVSVPGHAALQILHKQSAEFNALLAKVPYDKDLWDANAEDIDKSSPAAMLYTGLRKLPGMGRATTHKLMARKRPRLLPVFDSVVKEALQPHKASVWLPFLARTKR